MFHRYLAIGLTVLVLPLVAAAEPIERVSGVGDQTRLNLTIYNGSLALVHDRRRIALSAGENRIAWRDVSQTMDATSALLEDVTTPGAVRVTEQNYHFDVVSPSAILDRYVGHDVVVVHDAPMASPARETAQLLADKDGIVLQYHDRIETGLTNAHIIFPALPAGLRDRPTLTLDLVSDRAANPELDLAYLAGGLSWHAEYVASVAPSDDRLQLSGLITLTNESGTSFPDAHVQLVAGNVNVPPSDVQVVRISTVARASALEPPVTQENYFEYHLYTLTRPTSIENKQTKQVALLRAANVPVRKSLELRGSSSYYESQDADLGQRINVGAYLTFSNKGGALGIPLPGGIVRVYKNDRAGTSQFLGSDTIDHTPRNADVRLHLGDSFDVTAKKKQTDFHIAGGCTFESEYQTKIANAKTEPVDVLVVEPIPGDWTVISENIRHSKSSSATADWTVHVPPDGNTTLRYRVRVKYCG
jgi:hypothetical protein